MQLLLDSAVLEEARQAAAWGWVRGATTNPALLAKSSLPPEKILKKLGRGGKDRGEYPRQTVGA
jgi:transaldolase